MVLLHLVTDLYKIFSIKTICCSCYAFFSSLPEFFFKICSLVAVCHRRMHHNLYILPFVALVTFFFSPPYFFFLSLYGLIVAPCYRLIQIIPYKNHLSLLLRFFFLPFLIFSRYAVLLQFVTDLIQNILYKNHLSHLLRFFLSPSDFFFQDIHMYSLVAVCHRRIHHNLYINHLLHLLRFFSPPSYFFFYLCMVLLHLVTD